ncbi:MAG: sialate O-acetylesterase [Tannerella sp.]|jgi:sialate O-acetylesterase|nr:sialate O-acetylesterase [Tannerella sp.]
MKKKTLIVMTSLVMLVLNVYSEITLPGILDDRMVLQQKTEVKLWGDARPGSEVKIKPSWTDKIYAVKCRPDGKWDCNVSTPEAGGPYRISFSDGTERVLENVFVGEVWFCSGQSNMEMPMRGFDRQPVENANNVIAKAKTSVPIRMYTTDSEDGRWVRQFSKQPQTDCKGKWLDHTPENVANISAVAYFFAQYIQETLDVPVGIIVSSWGGSKVEAWMSKEALEPFEEISLSHLSNDGEIRNPTSTPCVLYNAKIAPLTNFAIKGFLWYQGESNRDNADQYGELMPAFVRDLRKKWNVGEFPFYYVQIAPFNYEGPDGVSSARLQEVQLRHMKAIPNAGMVTTLDIGHPVFIHPMNKKTVGERLACWALGNTYHRKGFGYKPAVYKSMEVAEGKAYIDFDNAPRGLCPMWTQLQGFEIAGEDRIFYPAKAEIETKTTRLAVSHEKVPNPVAVRYAYKNYAEASIFGIDGIPVAPFRTDNW